MGKIGGPSYGAEAGIDTSEVLLLPFGQAQSFQLVLTDGAAASASTVQTIDHQSTGPASAIAANFGSTVLYRLENTSGTLSQAAQVVVKWATPALGIEDATYLIATMVGGAMTTAANFRGGFIEIPNGNASLTAIKFSAGADQEIQKSTGKFGFGTATAHDVYTFVGNTTMMYFRITGSVGSACDITLGLSTALANNATGGFVFIPISSTTGAPSGVPTLTGVQANHAPLFFNTADNKLWIYNGAAWKSVTLV